MGEALLSHGASVSARDSDGQTALHLCAREGHYHGAKVRLIISVNSICYHLRLVFITTRIRRMEEGNVFSLFTPGGGVLHLGQGGYPPDQGRYPTAKVGTSQPRWVPPPAKVGTPSQGRYPPAKVGTPPQQR